MTSRASRALCFIPHSRSVIFDTFCCGALYYHTTFFQFPFYCQCRRSLSMIATYCFILIPVYITFLAFHKAFLLFNKFGRESLDKRREPKITERKRILEKEPGCWDNTSGTGTSHTIITSYVSLVILIAGHGDGFWGKVYTIGWVGRRNGKEMAAITLVFLT